MPKCLLLEEHIREFVKAVVFLLWFYDLTIKTGLITWLSYFSRVKGPVGDSEGTRTPDLQRDRLAFYATELRSHIELIDFSLNLYVYIISEILIKIKLFYQNFLLKKRFFDHSSLSLGTKVIPSLFVY